MAEKRSQQRRGSGSIRPKGNGFQVRVSAGRHPKTGKWVYLHETCKDEEEAEAARIRLVALVEAGKAIEAMETFGAAVQRWLESREEEVAAGDLAAETLSHYKNLAENHVIPVLGAMAVGSLERELVPAAEQLYKSIGKCRVRCQEVMEIEHYASGVGNARLVRDLTRHTCGRRCKPHTCVRASASMLRKVHGVITGTCAMLYRWGTIPADTSKRIKAPKAQQVNPKAPTTIEVAQLTEAAFAQDGDWGTIVWLLLVTGARRSEIARSQLKDVDFERSLMFIDSSKVEGTSRWVSLDEVTMGLLTAFRARIEERLNLAGLAITGEEYLYSYKADHSKPGSLSYFTNRFKNMGEAIGIDSHLHALRHYAATELIAGGVDIVSVARRLGHRAPSTTSDIYAAWRPEADTRAVSILAGGLALPAQTDARRAVRDYSAEQSSRTDPVIVEKICVLRRRTGWGPKRILEHLEAEEISVSESTVWAVLNRHGLTASREVIDAE
jgi:integrase